MTTLVAILGALPLALGTGPGHEIRQSLGIAIIGGLAVSQVITLFSTPVLFLLISGRDAQVRPGHTAGAVVVRAGA